ncbi:DNA-directed RNA polymerase I subunit RPA34 [Paramormyrops kingsleyae]|uniref:DNA-directed RNA polymerase I subunit RPA34 n=1 Tax=Paramormyrops kingsleyae TaxID=1676925 RepID=UPI000CD5E785|nr:DNA-directed RNA polymerase I subunit RPA34-like [Paramormyrops kingsleyae]
MSVKLKDVSSSSGAESDSETTEKEKKLSTKYRCPSDFVPCTYRPCENIRLDNLNDNCTELWLIKAPFSFSPNSFSDLKIPLRGSKSLQAESQKMETYRILSNTVGTRSMHLLSACGMQDGIVCGPTISGLINICEDSGDILSNQMITPLPASPAPSIPEGLKQRFTPFGCTSPPTPTTRRDKGNTSHGRSSSKRAKKDLEETENRKSKKKIKSNIKMEEEEGQMDVHQNLSCEAVTKKKKKKGKEKDKKKERLSIKEEPEIKTEPEQYA